jgi:plastocyanin
MEPLILPVKTALPVVLLALLASGCGRSQAPPASAPTVAGVGTVGGHVRLAGPPPENALIRMRSDPMCDTANAGKPVRYESVVVGSDGGLANVFVQLDGDFAGRPPPADAVMIDQRGCMYSPRVIAVQIGQPVRVRNSDPGLHNVHGVSSGRDGFNIGQPMAGMVNELRFKDAGILRLQCDVHGWMVAYVGVVAHPFFAVTDGDGAFVIRGVPPAAIPSAHGTRSTEHSPVT